MKQIILILLFIFTLQKKIHTDPPKDQHHKRGSFYELLFQKQNVIQDMKKNAG